MLLEEDKGASTRLPDAWMAELHKNRDSFIYSAERDLFWRLHARGVAHWPCTRWLFSIGTDTGPTQKSTVHVHPTTNRGVHVVFYGAWIGARRLPARLYMRLPIPSETLYTSYEAHEWMLDDVRDADRAWLLDIARHVVCARSR
jgi:hypothetical protein